MSRAKRVAPQAVAATRSGRGYSFAAHFLKMLMVLPRKIIIKMLYLIADLIIMLIWVTVVLGSAINVKSVRHVPDLTSIITQLASRRFKRYWL
jgi:hypothetical protein